MDGRAGVRLLAHRDAVLDVQNGHIDQTGCELTKSERSVNHPLAMTRHEHQRSHRIHQSRLLPRYRTRTRSWLIPAILTTPGSPWATTTFNRPIDCPTSPAIMPNAENTRQST